MGAISKHLDKQAQSAVPYEHAICLTDEADHCSECTEMCRDLTRLGGNPILGLFVFSSLDLRDAALDIVGDKYGVRFFESVNLPS